MSSAVQVLLSSYNGEKFIREQLDSILAQEGVNIRILVRDDGSADGTQEILREYRQANRNIEVLYGENFGAVKSVFTLIAAADKTVPYTAFADQDDVWLPDKLARAVSLLESGGEPDVPLAYCSAVQPTDAGLRPFRPAIRYRRIRAAFGNALVENMCTGCTCVINGTLRELLCQAVAGEEEPKSGAAAVDFPLYVPAQENIIHAGHFQKRIRTQEIIMHDFWIYLVAGAFGRVIYDEESRILYRQHGANTIGIASGVLENYRRRVRDFKRNRGKLKRQAEEFERLYGEWLAEQDAEKARLLRGFALGKRSLIFDKRLYRQRRSDNWIMRLLLLMGWL